MVVTHMCNKCIAFLSQNNLENVFVGCAIVERLVV